MNLLLISKYPLIEGGVSSQTYWLARAAQIVKTDKEPEYREHVIVQDISKNLGEYFEINDGKIYYCNGMKVEVSDIEKFNKKENYLMVIDFETLDVDGIISKIQNKIINKLLISIKNLHNSDSTKNKSKTIQQPNCFRCFHF